MIRVDQRDPRLGFVGDVREINPTIVLRMLREELIPVIATVGVDDDGQAYNVNADTRRRRDGRGARRREARVPHRRRGRVRRLARRDVADLADRRERDGAADRRREGLGGDDPQARVVRVGAASTACAARTSSTAACRTRCCSSSSRARESERWCDRDALSASWPALDAEQRHADLRPAARRVRARRGHDVSGTARASSISTSCRASRSRRSGTRTPRSPTRSPSRRARCCTCRISITTTCSRGSPSG